MLRLSPMSLRLIEQLSDRASLCHSLFSAWTLLADGAAVGVKDLTAAAGLSVSEEHGTDEILRTLGVMGFVAPRAARWVPTPGFQSLTAELATVFAAIDHYRGQVHKDATEAQIVLTRPTQALALEAILTEAGWRTTSTEETAQAFTALVQRARRRVVVITPFLDESGAEWLKELLSPLSAHLEIVLVLRSLEDATKWDYPAGFLLLRDWLRQRRVKILNYSLPRSPGPSRETFHAKIMLADDHVAYVGSANFTAASRDYSMEMGIVVKGRAAYEISIVVEAIIKAAETWPL
jgi:hypothetical protein